MNLKLTTISMMAFEELMKFDAERNDKFWMKTINNLMKVS